MISTKICSVFVIVTVLCVTRLVVGGPVERIPRQTAASEQGGTVLFFAAFQGSLRDAFDPIIFNQVVVNQGSAYSNTTGVFTAPVAGIYQFVFAAQLCRGDHNNRWHFVVMENHRMGCHAQLSSTATTLNTCYFMEELKRGDQVWIKQKEGTCAWASSTSMTINFSGVLLAREGASMLGRKYDSGSSSRLPSLGHNRNMVSASEGLTATWSSVAIALLLRCLFLD